MKNVRFFLDFVLVSSVILLLLGCSNVSNPIDSDAQANVPEISSDTGYGNHHTMGVYQAVIDPDAQTFKIEPVNRELCDGLHLWLSKHFDNLIEIEDYSFTPTFWADITLQHPLPGSGITGYDPRLIAELQATPGLNAAYYPAMDIVTNNKVVKNPDGYTKLKDTGIYNGNTNPFLAYFKDEPYRQWASTGVTSDTRRWEMDLSGFGGTFEYFFIVEVSTNFPNPPHPITDNCPECINIRCEQESILINNTRLDVILHDWQGEDTIGSTKVEAPGVFSGTYGFSWDGLGPGTYDSRVHSDIVNELHPLAGTYNMMISSHDFTWNLYMYQEFKLQVGASPSPEIIETLDLSGSAHSVFVSGDYAYVCDGDLRIIDIADPYDISLVKTVVTPGQAREVHVQGDYAYVVEYPFEYDNALHIIDINPPLSAYIVNTMSIMASDVFTSGNYAYVGNWSTRLDVIDINPPESMHIVGDVLDIIEIENVFKTGSYAYVTDTIPQFHIINVASPTSPYISKTIDITGIGKSIQVANNYAYVADSAGLQIIDVYPTSSASVVKTINFAEYPSRASGVALYDGYALVSDGRIGLHIIDVDPIPAAFIEDSVSTPGWAYDVAQSDGFAYVADGSNGLVVISLW